jgi:hypothetical protein
MIKRLKQLPTEIIDTIFSYTYSPQPQKLMTDVRNFVKTLNEIEHIYYSYWIEGLPFPFMVQTNQDKQWLFRDLFGRFYSTSLKLFINKLYKHSEEIPATMWNAKVHQHTHCTTDGVNPASAGAGIRVIWGTLTFEQRDLFVEERKKLMIDNRLSNLKCLN